MHTVDRQWVEMKDLEFYPVTLCSRWRSGQAGQACPKRKRERMSGREEMDELKKDGWGTGLLSLFLFVCLTCRNTCVSYFLMGSSVLCMVHRPHSIPFLILSSPSPPCCPAEATPEPSHRGSDPSWPTAKRKDADRGQRREKGDSIEGREISEQDEAAGTH